MAEPSAAPPPLPPASPALQIRNYMVPPPLDPPPPPPPPPPPQQQQPQPRSLFPFPKRRPSLRVTSEFDSDSSISCTRFLASSSIALPSSRSRSRIITKAKSLNPSWLSLPNTCLFTMISKSRTLLLSPRLMLALNCISELPMMSRRNKEK